MLVSTTPSEVNKSIVNLKKKKNVSAGDDEIKALPINYVAALLSPILF